MLERASPITRRSFLLKGAAAGGGLLIGVPLAAGARTAGRKDPARGDDGSYEVTAGRRTAEELNAFVEILPNGSVALTVPCPELGQGVRTSLAMILAEELGADWTKVSVKQAAAGEAYGGMTVGGSDSVADYWEPLRLAGAAARQMLVTAAAARWAVDEETCEARAGQIVHGPSGRTLSFGELAADAGSLPVPESPALKDPASFRIIGKATGSVDEADIVSGRAVYGLDLQVDGGLVAVVARSPVHGGRVASFRSEEALAVPGVRQVFEVEPLVIGGQLYGAVRSGVAVIADSTWSAMRGRDALEVEWEHGPNATENSAAIERRFADRSESLAEFVLRDEIGSGGESRPRHDASGTAVRAEYVLPILAHGCMEPMNFTADVREDRCEVWGPTQTPRFLQAVLAAGLGLPREAVFVQPTLGGGGFGRRLAYDYAVEAAMISRSVASPVKVVWTREDDFAHDYYRSPSRHVLQADLGSDGTPNSWRHHVLSASLARHSELPSSAREAPHPGIYDVQGAADMPYAIDRVLVEYTPLDVGLQMGSWRSVAHSFNVFAVESFLDEIAATGGLDPLQLRLDLLPTEPMTVDLPLPGRRGRPRPDRVLLRRVLLAAAKTADWATPLPPGRGRGIACSYYKHTYAAHVAEVTVSSDGAVRVDRLVTAVACGTVVNPSGVEAQVEGAAMDGTATVLKWGITLRDGIVQEKNFDAYPMLRLDEAPAVTTVILPSDRPPSGMGEPPYPGVPPAIANAVFAAGGGRIRRLPLG